MPEDQQPKDTKKKIKIIGIIILIMIVIIAILIWLLSRADEDVLELPINDNSVTTPTGTGLPGGGTTAPVGADIITEPAEPDVIEVDQQTSLKQLARSFTERYGSYSNQSDFENLVDLTALMSQAMAARTESYIESAREVLQDNARYSGTTTRALSVKIDSYNEDDGEAVVTVTAQRRESSDIAQDRIYYQSLTIEFIKVRESWKADSATWNEEGL